jgi:RNA polymerase sigma-70 factor (ECF subfamily)
LQDAEDILQETLLAAWQGLGGYEGRASIRTWLYRIATNRCLNALRSANRRPSKEWDMPNVETPEPTGLGEIVWLEPYPDALLRGAIDVLGPEARYEQSEAISLAFVTALQVLPPRQLAVLILRDVLGFHASEVADILDATVESVNSALKRARASMRRRTVPVDERGPAPAPDSPSERALVAEFVRGHASRGSGCAGRLVYRRCFRLCASGFPSNTQGQRCRRALFASIFGSSRRVDLVPTRANGQPAFGAYLRASTGIRHGSGLFVLTVTDDRISAFTRFDSSVLPWFGLPRSLPSR